MIVANNISLQRGTKFLLEESNLTIHPGQKVGLVGQNGCGKSSLFALLKNQLQVDAGNLSVPSKWEISSVAQETPELKRKAIDYVIDGDQEFRQLERDITAAEEAEKGELIATLHTKMDTIGGYQIKTKAAELLAGLGFSEAGQQQSVSDFSGGWRMRLNLAQALLVRSDLLLLDEPTNHLDLDTVVWLEQWLKRYPGTLILISHDRDFLDNIINRIVHIEHQKLNEYTGGYSDFEQMRAMHLAQQQAMYEKQQRERAHMQGFVDRFRYKASKAKQAQSRLKALEKMEVISQAHVDSQFSFQFRKPDNLPLPLLTMEKVSAGYEDKTILEQVKFNLVPGSRIGLLGRNGAGKSTFIKLLSGELKALAGNVEINKMAKVGYFAQHQLETLRPDDTPMQHLQRLAPNTTEAELRKYLGSFGFQGDQALEKVAPFSGGEKARLVLALVVWQKPNLLLLDEPTNHLDLEMRHALTLALQEFTGAMIIVSHDRALLRATTDEFYLVDSQRVSPFEGDLDDYQQWLSQANRQINSNGTESSATGANPVNQRKEQKRREAEFRQQTKGIRKQLESLEKSSAKAQQRLDEVEQKMAEPELYEADNKAQLQKCLQQQAELKSELEETELSWFDLQEQLEERQQAFGIEQES
ncbi:ABC transporter ATP-binding protein [Agarivorans sp. Toyoura001]|uniref:ABC transporter ATP-binding protein n=1 Tax=Agarivorans sp. Toyoura001 TaxID=2283141 RepID=UPI0010EA1061|nr:ABC transporter ATP-binding protein [Agarivorans sp. Toyoura001]GDY26630.1 ABC transporter ATP-binding protein [Agarivorans sp. Toyoura001]